MPTRNASARTGTTSITEAKRAMKKANRPAPMQPRLVYEAIPARVVRPVPHAIHAGWGSGSQVTVPQNYLLPYAAHLRYSGTLPTSIPEQRACHKPEIKEPLKSTKPVQPKKLRSPGTFAVCVRHRAN